MGRYRTHLPRPASAGYLRSQIAKSVAFIAWMEREGNGAAADYERGRLAAFEAELERRMGERVTA